MDRIDELLVRLIDEQDTATFHQCMRSPNRAVADLDRSKALIRRDALRDEIAADWRAREALVAELVEALEEVEWLPWYYHGTRRGKRCPWCIHLQTNGHSDDCQRQALLARVKGE